MMMLATLSLICVKVVGAEGGVALAAIVESLKSRVVVVNFLKQIFCEVYISSSHCFDCRVDCRRRNNLA